MCEKCVRCSAIRRLAYETFQEIRRRKTHSPLGSLRSCDRGSTRRQPPHIKSLIKSNRPLNLDHAGSRARTQVGAAARFQELVHALAQDSLRLLRTRRYSSASISVIPSRWASKSSLWRRATLTSGGRLSAMNMTASSGPPSPTRSSARGRRSRPGGRRLTLRSVFLRSGFFKQTHPNWRI